jgi:hypothetical protein
MIKSRRVRRRVQLGIVSSALVAWAVACSDAGDQRSSSSDGTGGRGGGAGGGSGAAGGGGTGGTQQPFDAGQIDVPDAPTGQCKNLQCRQTVCSAGAKTTLTGTVYAPNGTLPLYNALVYVPNVPLPPIPPGLTCDRCGTIPQGEPVVAALTDHRGVFVLDNVPVGQDIPLVIQVGKWRRQVVIPEVASCTETRLTDPELTRLPRNRSEGDMPRIAVTTGICDNITCLLPKLGIDEQEIGIAGDDVAITFYGGGPAGPSEGELTRYEPRLQQMTLASGLWSDLNELQKYDMGLFSCECEEAPGSKGPAAYEAMTRYLDMGGRVFGTDYQYVWYKYSPDPNLQNALAFRPSEFGDLAPAVPVRLDTSFPKGKALADWLANLRPGSSYGEVTCEQVWDNLRGANEAASQVWGVSPPPATEMTTSDRPRFVTINTPAGVASSEQCGRAVHLDAHITSSSTILIEDYPEDCGTELLEGEEVLAFFFFDVASCIQDDGAPVVVPPVVE